MKARAPDEFLIEPERYELQGELHRGFHLDRRRFFKILGGGIVVLLLVDAAPVRAQESGERPRGRGGRGRGAPRPVELSAWLHIGEHGEVTVFTGKAEVGQNIRTSLTQAVAEELPVAPASIQLIMADTERVPFDMGTFGSRTTPDMAVQMRRVGAAARDALLELAMASFAVERNVLRVAQGKVERTDTGETLSFGQLTRGQKLVKTIDERLPIKPATEWKIAGSSLGKVDGADFVTGGHKYASDVALPGMLHGKVLRPVSFEATLTALDDTGARALPGVTVVREGGFVGVTAPDSFNATRALAALKPQWEEKAQPSSRELFDLLAKPRTAFTNDANAAPAPPARDPAPGGDAQANDLRRLERRYTISYIAHAPLEPRAAVAQWQDDKLTVWTGTQRPFGVRSELARTFGLDEAKVRVIAPDTGAGYGGKHTGEAAIEAARLAKVAGKPVKLVWTREEEFTWAYFRPAGVIDIASAVRPDGTIAHWEFHNYNSGGSAIRSPYDVPNQRSEFHNVRAPLKQGSYRGLAATANVFAREMHMDELAHAAALDPLEFRLKNLKEPRLRAVLEAAAKAFNWTKRPRAQGRGFGLACGTEKGSFVATCAELTADAGGKNIKLQRVVAAFECGAIVNPDQLKNQIEGAIVMGIGGALFEAIDFANGKIVNPRFSNYRVPRFRDVPSIEVVLVDRKDLPSAGAGETPIVGIAPAIGNALFDAAGVRWNSLPLRAPAIA
jgi:isoquinoline 1-oxidoreductase